MEHVHSILLIKKDNKYLTYYDNNWKIRLFPNIKENNIEDIKKYIKDNYNIETDNIKLLFDKVHDKYSVHHDEMRTYHHYFYEIGIELDDDLYQSLDELLQDENIVKYNSDIISYVKEYYNK